MSDGSLYARLNRHQTHVVCGWRTDCGGRFGTLERNDTTDDWALPMMEVLGPVSGYRVIHAGELYVWMLSGFMADTDDEVWRVSRGRRDQWRRGGLPPDPRFSSGQQRAIPELPCQAECLECLQVQIIDADHLGIATLR